MVLLCQMAEISIPNSVAFTVGQKFESFEVLEGKIKEFEKECFVQLWKRDARTLEAARKRVDRCKSMKADLKYYQMKYCCIHGGKNFKAEGRGIRKNTM